MLLGVPGPLSGCLPAHRYMARRLFFFFFFFFFLSSFFNTFGETEHITTRHSNETVNAAALIEAPVFASVQLSSWQSVITRRPHI
ncbi:hypothetical protein IWX50DRAFT_436396 [Phyllosticta citricarpa]